MKPVATVEMTRPTRRGLRGSVIIWAPQSEHAQQAAAVAHAAAIEATAGAEIQGPSENTYFVYIDKGKHNIGKGAYQAAVNAWACTARDAAKAKLRELGYTVRRYLP